MGVWNIEGFGNTRTAGRCCRRTHQHGLLPAVRDCRGCGRGRPGRRSGAAAPLADWIIRDPPGIRTLANLPVQGNLPAPQPVESRRFLAVGSGRSRIHPVPPGGGEFPGRSASGFLYASDAAPEGTHRPEGAPRRVRPSLRPDPRHCAPLAHLTDLSAGVFRGPRNSESASGRRCQSVRDLGAHTGHGLGEAGKRCAGPPVRSPGNPVLGQATSGGQAIGSGCARSAAQATVLRAVRYSVGLGGGLCSGRNVDHGSTHRDVLQRTRGESKAGSRVGHPQKIPQPATRRFEPIIIASTHRRIATSELLRSPVRVAA